VKANPVKAKVKANPVKARDRATDLLRMGFLMTTLAGMTLTTQRSNLLRNE